MFHSSGGTAKASTMLQNQLVAVDSDTALARIRDGKISAGYVHEQGPHVQEADPSQRRPGDAVLLDGRLSFRRCRHAGPCVAKEQGVVSMRRGGRPTDVIVCTQSLHHFGPGMVARMLGEAARSARAAVVFIDGERGQASTDDPLCMFCVNSISFGSIQRTLGYWIVGKCVPHSTENY